MTIAPERKPPSAPVIPAGPNWTLVAVLVLIILGLVAAVVVLATDNDEATAERIAGSGTVVVESRAVSDFDAITLESSGTVLVTQGAEESLTIETDENLLPYIESDVRNGTLRLSTPDGRELRPSDEILFTIVVRDLTAVEVLGAGDFEIGALRTDDLSVQVAGATDLVATDLTVGRLVVRVSGYADVAVAGTADFQEIGWLGAGTYRAGDLESRSTDVSVAGSGTIDVWATETLDIGITGAGNVSYYGNPALTQRIAGAGTIKSLGGR